MHRSTRQTLIAWLCLICFGLGSTLFNGHIVLCQHSDGTSDFELGSCTQDGSGLCTTGCTDPESPEAPQPCKDTPVKADGQLAKSRHTRPLQPPSIAGPILAILMTRLEAVPRGEYYRHAPTRDRPPDALVRLRTVILLV